MVLSKSRTFSSRLLAYWLPCSKSDWLCLAIPAKSSDLGFRMLVAQWCQQALSTEPYAFRLSPVTLRCPFRLSASTLRCPSRLSLKRLRSVAVGACITLRSPLRLSPVTLRCLTRLSSIFASSLSVGSPVFSLRFRDVAADVVYKATRAGVV